MHYLVKPSVRPAMVQCLYLDQILCGGPEQALYPGGPEGALVVAHNSVNNCNNAKTVEDKVDGNDRNYFGTFADGGSQLRLGRTPVENNYYPESAGFKLYALLNLWPLKNIALDISAPDDPQWYFEQDAAEDIYSTNEGRPPDSNSDYPIWYKHMINEWLADRHIQQERSAFEEDDASLIYGSGITWQEGLE